MKCCYMSNTFSVWCRIHSDDTFGLVLSFTVLSLCLNDKKNGQTCPNAGHEGVWGSGCIGPDVHNFGTRWK